MKILAWLMFGTSVVCFVVCFCRQQLDVQIADAASASQAPVIHWERFADSGDNGTREQSPTTQPSRQMLGAQPTIASNDLHDAMK